MTTRTESLESSFESISQYSQPTSLLIPNVSDHPSLQITQNKVNRLNYVEWSQSILLVIEGRETTMVYLIGETMALAEGSAKYKKWRFENSMVKAWRISSMEKGIGRTYLYFKTTKEIWDTVAKLYSDVGNSTQIFELKSMLKEKKQGDKFVTEYYNELLGLWQELDAFQDYDWSCTFDSAKYQKMLNKE